MTKNTLIIDETIDDDRQEGSAGIVINETGDPAAATIINEDGDAGPGLPAEAKVNEDGSVTLTLKYPKQLTIRSGTGKVREETYVSLTFHRMTGADMNAIQATSSASATWLAFARLTRTKEAIMRHLFEIMDGYDIANGAAIIEYFLPSGRKTGKSS